MSRTFLISDHHFGHKKVQHFEPTRPQCSLEEHDDWLVAAHNSRITKRDTVWFLGDVGFCKEAIERNLPKMNGTKNLILGNHDHYGFEFYSTFFNKVKALQAYKDGVLTHVPLHNRSLDRWRRNYHGHIHSNEPFSEQHVNCCVERCEGVPRTLEEWVK